MYVPVSVDVGLSCFLSLVLLSLSCCLSLILSVPLSFFLSLSCFPSLSLSPIGCFGVWFRVLGVCRLERTDSFGDVRQEEWERRVSLVIIR